MLQRFARTVSRRNAPLQAQVRAMTTTYSGGQPSEGQGGFYGALKTRTEDSTKFTEGTRAEPADIELLRHTILELNSLPVGGEQYNKLLKEQAVGDMLERLMVRGSPAWGLSLEERSFVVDLDNKKRML